jgi:hypothetical protein
MSTNRRHASLCILPVLGLALAPHRASDAISSPPESVGPVTTVVDPAAGTPAAGAPAAADNDRMDWWREARFGMFIHWGLYAIPAGQWGDRTDHGEWIMNTAHIPVEQYEKFRDQFNPVKFDADKWVAAAKAAGMKYIVITSKHHDGFCLFDTKYTDWSVMHTPFHRDIMKEIADACRKQGVTICWYHSIMDWHHPDYLPRRDWETRPTTNADFDRFNRTADELWPHRRDVVRRPVGGHVDARARARPGRARAETAAQRHHQQPRRQGRRLDGHDPGQGVRG